MVPPFTTLLPGPWRHGVPEGAEKNVGGGVSVRVGVGAGAISGGGGGCVLVEEWKGMPDSKL